MTRADLLVAVVLLPAFCLLAVVWEERRDRDSQIAALTLPLMGALAWVLWELCLLSGRTGMPLRDAELGRMDAALGVNVPEVVAWMTLHPWLNAASFMVYASLDPLLRVAMFAPALFGKREAAWRFLTANAVAIAASSALFLAFPAIGPWVGAHVVPSALQRDCEVAMLAARMGRETSTPILVCFPSFHVIWAVVAVDALWWVRRARVPLAVLAGLIVLSTLTTGWHYAVDVIAGGGIAAGALVATRLLWRWRERRGYAVPRTLEPAASAR